MNVPHFQQELDYSCLPACVCMVLAYYGEQQRPESDLRRLFEDACDGNKPGQRDDTATRYRFSSDRNGRFTL